VTCTCVLNWGIMTTIMSTLSMSPIGYNLRSGDGLKDSFSTTPTRGEARQSQAAAQEIFTRNVCARLEYLNASDVALLSSKSKPRFYGAGEPLIKEGSISPGFFMIRSGEAEVRRNGMVLAKFGSGDVCGEMSFLEDSNASASVVATGNTAVEFLAASELTNVFLAFPHLASRFYRSMALTLSRRLRTTSQQLCTAQAERK
jgi:CRP-like cAMP-binding protein